MTGWNWSVLPTSQPADSRTISGILVSLQSVSSAKAVAGLKAALNPKMVNARMSAGLKYFFIMSSLL